MSDPAFATLADLAIYNVAPPDIGKTRYVRANDTFYEALYEGVGLDRWEARRVGTSPILTGLQSLGFDRARYPVQSSGPVALAATSGTAQIAGPAAGYIRIIGFANITTATATSATIAAQFNAGSGGPFLFRAFAIAVTVATASSFIGTSNVIFLSPGETLDFANTGSGAAVLYYTYVDVADTNLTAVRISCSDTPLVEAIPAAATGYYHRIASFFNWSGVTNLVHRPIWFATNDDTAAAQLCAYIDPTPLTPAPALVSRGGSIAANSNFAFQGPGAEMRLTTQSLKYGLRAAQTARPVQISLIYETLPLAA